MSEYPRRGRLLFTKLLLKNENIMRQIFSNGMIVLDIKHNTFDDIVEYLVAWGKFPEVIYGNLPPQYAIMCDTNNNNIYVEIDGNTIPIANTKGFLINLNKDLNKSEIWYNGIKMDNVLSIEIKVEPDKLTTATLKIIPDKITGTLTEVKIKPVRNIILDK